MKTKLPQSRYLRLKAFKQALKEYNNEPVTHLGMTFPRGMWKDVIYLALFLLILSGGAVDAYLHKPMISPIPVVQAAQTGVRDLNPLSLFATTETISGRASIPTPTPTLTVQQQQTWDDFVRAALTISKIYNFPAKVVISQAALESKHGTSEFAVQRQNYLGIGAYDDNPNAAYTFENQEQCLVEYMRIIRENFPEAWDNRDNPEQLLRLLKYNSQGNYYASDPNYVSKVMSMSEWRKY